MNTNRTKAQQDLRDYAVMTLGILLTVVAVYFFKFPNNFSTGGVTGIAVVVARLVPGLSVTMLSNIMNIFLLVLGLLLVGRDFGIKTVFATLLLTALLFALERFVPLHQPLTDQPFMELIISMFLTAAGAALLFNVGASSGGTDVVAMIIKKYTNIYSISAALMAVDFLAAVSTFFIFDIKTGLFSLFGLVIFGAILAGVLNALRQRKYFHIITTDPELVRAYIIGTIGRSATIFEGRGAYTGEPRTLIITVVNARQAVQLKDFIKENSPSSFLLITNTDDILGKGFRNMV